MGQAAAMRVVEKEWITQVLVGNGSVVRLIKGGMTDQLDPRMQARALAQQGSPTGDGGHPMWNRDIDG